MNECKVLLTVVYLLDALAQNLCIITVWLLSCECCLCCLAVTEICFRKAVKQLKKKRLVLF